MVPLAKVAEQQGKYLASCINDVYARLAATANAKTWGTVFQLNLDYDLPQRRPPIRWRSGTRRLPGGKLSDFHHSIVLSKISAKAPAEEQSFFELYPQAARSILQ